MHRGFGWLWTATGAANVGDGVVVVAVPLIAVGIGATAAEVAVVTAATTLAWPLLGLPAGWIVDRVERRRLLALANLARSAVLVAGAFAALTGNLSVPALVAIAASYGAAETLVDTALMGLVPAYASRSDRTKANARIESTVNVSNQLLGPPMAGLLVGIGSAVAFGSVSALYLIAAVAALALLRSRSAPKMAELGSRGRHLESTSMLDGLRLILHSPTLRQLTLLTAGMNLVWGCFGALFVVHALDERGLALTSTQYGLVLTAMAVGGLGASVVADRLRRAMGARILLAADCVGSLLLVAPAALDLGVTVTVAGVVIAGAGATLWRILVGTLRQWAAPDRLLGRVYSASRVISWGTLPAGALLAGGLASVWDVRSAFVCASVLALLVLVWFVVFTRHLDLTSAFDPASNDVVDGPHGRGMSADVPRLHSDLGEDRRDTPVGARPGRRVDHRLPGPRDRTSQSPGGLG